MANRLFQEARQFVELAKETAAFGTEQEKKRNGSKSEKRLIQCICQHDTCRKSTAARHAA